MKGRFRLPPMTATQTAVLVAVTLTLMRYAEVRCPCRVPDRAGQLKKCNRLLFTMPTVTETRIARDNTDRVGVGPIGECVRCGALVEAVIRRAA